MKHRKHLVKGMLALVLLAIAIGGGVARGQEPAPQSSASVQAALGTAFTYQGRLTDGGVPADGTYDFKFRLWDAATDGSQVGSDIIQDDVTVTDGLFAVQLDFGSSAFTGEARYLGIGVRPGGSTGAFTALAPRQPLAPAPYALALPGLWTQQNVTSPNLIGGYSGNSVTDGVVGATIGGGGTSSAANQVTDDYGTVGGGRSNQAGDGDANLTSSFYATVGGGMGNTASSFFATVGGGQGNTASNEGATIGGGGDNTADGFRATIGGGYQNTASGNRSTIPGGSENIALGKFSFATGAQAQAGLYGQMAFASGQFATVGDAQTSVFVLRNTTTDATSKDLFLDGINTRLVITSNHTVTFDILVAARSDGGASAGYRIRGVIENTAGNTDFVGTPTVETLGEEVASWDVAVLANDTYDALVVRVTGDASRVIRWVAAVKTAEVGW